MSNYETILAEKRGRVTVITINRPDKQNAINSTMTSELLEAVAKADADPEIGCILVTGARDFFVVGADIGDYLGETFVEMYNSDHYAEWERYAAVATPIVAAVAGPAVGDGCEIALMSDLVIAADTARFEQPEIGLAVMPGMGASQRLARSIGKAKAMDMCLTGRAIDAIEAERIGLVSRVVPAAGLLTEAMKVAEKIASTSRLAARMAKESVNRAFETPLSEGLRFERRMYHAMFATHDQEEGMQAYIDKRQPEFTQN